METDTGGMAEPGISSIKEVSTATELRKRLHAMKHKDREALSVAAAKSTPASRFLQSSLFTAIATALGVFGLLYISNPALVQEPRERYQIAKPSLKRVAAWAILAGLIVLVGPWLYQKFSAPK